MKLLPPLLGATLAALLRGCAGAPSSAPATPGTAAAPTGPVVTGTAPRGETGPVEVGGIAPNDTVVTVERGVPRVVVMRHGPPDRADFLVLMLPASVFAQASRDTVRVTIRTVPGVYGADLSADADWGAGASLAFEYAVHFFLPADALRRYHTLAEVERRLTVARKAPNGDLTFYYSARPNPDVLRAMIPGPGTYLMVVAR